MNNDLYSKKYMLIIAAMCILLLALTIKAFDYLPDKNGEQKKSSGPTREEEYNYINAHPENYEQKLKTEYSDMQYVVKNSPEEDEGEDEDEDDDEDDTTTQDVHHKHGHIDYMPSPSSGNIDFDEIPAPKGTVEEEINATN